MVKRIVFYMVLLWQSGVFAMERGITGQPETRWLLQPIDLLHGYDETIRAIDAALLRGRDQTNNYGEEKLQVLLEHLRQYPHSLTLQMRLALLVYNDALLLSDSSLRNDGIHYASSLFNSLKEQVDNKLCEPTVLTDLVDIEVYIFYREYYRFFGKYKELYKLGMSRLQDDYASQRNLGIAKDRFSLGVLSAGMGAVHCAMTLMEGGRLAGVTTARKPSYLSVYAHNAHRLWSYYLKVYPHNDNYVPFIYYALACAIKGGYTNEDIQYILTLDRPELLTSYQKKRAEVVMQWIYAMQGCGRLPLGSTLNLPMKNERSLNKY